MNRWIAALFVAGVAVSGLQAAEMHASPSITELFAAGETLDFDLSWLGISGGSARMTIAPVPDEPTRFHMTFVGRSASSFAFIFKVRDSMESTVNRDDFSTLRYAKHLNERGRVKDETTTIDEGKRIATRKRPKRDTEEIPVPKPVFDPLSLVYHLRALELQPGTTQRFAVLADGRRYTLEARVSGRETLSTAAGSFNTLVVQPKMLAGGLFGDEGALTIWYSDDPRHIPVRIRSDVKIGSITATLRAVRSGVPAPEPAAEPRSK